MNRLVWIRIFLTIGFFLFQALSETTPPTGLALLKTDLLGVFAHPDDETGVAAALVTLARGQGKTLAHVYCTRGEGGGNMVGTQGGPALGLLREQELRNALRLIGVQQVHFLDRADFAYTESLAITLEKWGHEETLRRLVRVIRSIRPEVIITMNPAPVPGQHGNHQAAGWLATEAFTAAADPLHFPEQLSVEGLSVWQPRKLFFNGTSGAGDTLVQMDISTPLPDGRFPSLLAGEALSHHRSQGFGDIGDSPWFRRQTQQSFTPVLSVLPIPSGSTNLFADLPLSQNIPVPRLIPPHQAMDSTSVSFRPRPAVGAYRHFVIQNGIQKAAENFPADLPVIVGEVNRLSLESTRELLNGRWTFEGPADWPSRFRGGNGVDISVPATAVADIDFLARVQSGAQTQTTTVRLHPVPRLKVPRLKRLPWTGSDTDPIWAGLTPIPIDATQSWQGKSDGPTDFSGSFRMAHDGASLFVEVRVSDNIVVSNITPNDIKGHWRSDSVEICIDPSAGAEHTLGCWKAGVFPFDSTGKVRGSRDADAKPGPLETASPGTRLLSWRTGAGYALRIAIPLKEAGLNPARLKRAGFNILLYDGDKVGAAPGENINRTRLAWAPRPGVQGRPEDWGRIDFD